MAKVSVDAVPRNLRSGASTAFVPQLPEQIACGGVGALRGRCRNFVLGRLVFLAVLPHCEYRSGEPTSDGQTSQVWFGLREQSLIGLSKRMLGHQRDLQGGTREHILQERVTVVVEAARLLRAGEMTNAVLFLASSLAAVGPAGGALYFPKQSLTLPISSAEPILR
jgi:hypothetical protein